MSIIEQYLKDEEIPLQRRRNLAVDLDTNAITKEEAQKVLEFKYPARYGLPEVVRPESIAEPSQPITAPGVAEAPDLSDGTAGLLDKAKGFMGGLFRKKSTDDVIGDKLAWSEDQRAYYAGLPTEERDRIERDVATPQYLGRKITEGAKIKDPADIIGDKVGWTSEQREYFRGLPVSEQRNIQASVAPSASLMVDPLGTLEGARESAKGLATELWNRTLGGAIELPVKYGGFLYRGAQAMDAALPFMKMGDYKRAYEAWNEAASEPLMLFGEDVNWWAPEGGIDMDELLGSHTKSAGSATNIAMIANPTMAVKFSPNFLAGFLYGAGESIEEGDTLGQAMVTGVRDGTIQGLAAKIFGIVQKHAAKAKISNAEKQLMKQGMTRDEAHLVSKLTPAQQQAWKEGVKVQSKFAAAGGQGDDVFSHFGNELDDFFDDGINQLDDAVKSQYKAATDKLGNYKVSPKPAQNALKQMVDDVGAKVSKVKVGGKAAYQIDFTGTSMDGIPKEMKNLFNKLYNDTVGKSISAQKLGNLRTYINKTMKVSKGKMYTPTVEVKYITQFKDGIDDAILGSSIPKETKSLFVKALKDYQKYYNARNMVYQMGVDKVGDKIVFRGDRVLRQLQQVNRKKAQALLKVLEETGEHFKIPVPKNIADKSYVATVVQGISGKSPALGFQASVAQGSRQGIDDLAQMARSKGGMISNVLKKGYNVVSGDMPPLTTERLAQINVLAQQAWKQSANKGIVQMSKEGFWEVMSALANLERITHYGIPKTTEAFIDTAGDVAEFGVDVVSGAAEATTGDIYKATRTPEEIAELKKNQPPPEYRGSDFSLYR